MKNMTGFLAIGFVMQRIDEKIDQHDVPKYLGASTWTVRTLIKRGEQPPPQHGRGRRGQTSLL
jgi:hypothetical protein